MKLKLSLLTMLIFVGLSTLFCPKELNAKVELKLNIPKGYSAILRMTMKANSINTVREKENKDQMHMVYEYLIDCINVEPNGTMTIKQTLKAIKINNKKDGGTGFEYDSNNPDTEISKGFAAQIAPLQKSLVMKVTPNAKIIYELRKK